MGVEIEAMSVATLPVTGEPRTHITMSVEALAERLALAEESGFNFGLCVAELPDRIRYEHMQTRREEFDRKVRLYIAQLSKHPGA